MTVNFQTLFTRFGKAFALGNTILQNITTDAAVDLEDFLDQMAAMDELDQVEIADGTNDALASFRSSGAAAIGPLVQTPCERILVKMIKADNPQKDEQVSTALAELRRQMLLSGDTLDASTPAITITYGEGAGSSSGPPAGNTGDGLLVLSTKRGDGLVNEHILAETIDADITAVSSDGSATWTLTGEKGADSDLAWNWPLGTAITKAITANVGAGGNNELTNGSFETEDDHATNLPNGWIAPTATLGTTLKLTDVEVQTIVISGTPTGGYYQIKWTDGDGRTYWTAPLAWNDGQSQVQTALRAIPGLGSITAVTTGTSPDYTHTVTMTGVNNPAQFTSENALTGGTPVITHNTTTPASQYALRGAVAVEFDSDGAELTTIMCPVTLSAATPYALCAFMAADVTPAAGAIVMDLVDGVGGTVLADDQGVNNTVSVDCTGLTSSHAAQTEVFRTPTDLPTTVYLRIRISAAVSNTTSIYIDEVSLVEMTELYAGGPFAAAFAGGTDHLVGDDATITITNDRAGALHEWMARIFNLRQKRLLIPTDNSGSETIDDALIV